MALESQPLDARAAWNAGASAYIHFVESGLDYYRHLVHGPGLLEACGAVRGALALDLGCGHGYFARLLVQAGAVVAGVDLGDEFISWAIAQEKRVPLGITYHRLDAACVAEHFPAGAFDLVTGCMALQDMDDTAAVLVAGATVLRPGGRFVFSVPHPASDPPVRVWERDAQGKKIALRLDRYFDTGPAVCHWNMPRLQASWSTPYRRFTLSEWSRLIATAGLVIRGLSEPRPSAELVAAHPDLEDCARMPYFLIFDLAKDVTSAPAGR